MLVKTDPAESAQQLTSPVVRNARERGIQRRTNFQCALRMCTQSRNKILLVDRTCILQIAFAQFLMNRSSAAFKTPIWPNLVFRQLPRPVVEVTLVPAPKVNGTPDAEYTAIVFALPHSSAAAFLIAFGPINRRTIPLSLAPLDGHYGRPSGEQ